MEKYMIFSKLFYSATIICLILITVVTKAQQPLTYNVIVEGNMYSGIPNEGIIRVNISDQRQFHRFDPFMVIKPNETVMFRLQGKFMYAVSSTGIGGSGSGQSFYTLVRMPLDKFQLDKSGDMKVPSIKSLQDTPDYLASKNQIILEPLLKASTNSAVLMIPLYYDFTIGTNDQITLYISHGKNLEVWRHPNVEDAKWIKGELLDLVVDESFIVIDEGGTESILLTESGEIHHLNGKSHTNLTQEKSKIKNLADRENDIPMFIENKDSGERWIVNTKRRSDGTVAVSNSRSIKAGKIEDSALPANLANALNNTLKIKSDSGKK